MVKTMLLMAVGMTLQVQWQYEGLADSIRIYHWVAGRDAVKFARYSTVAPTVKSKVFAGLSSNQKHFFAATGMYSGTESPYSNIVRTGVPSAIVRGKVTGNVQ